LQFPQSVLPLVFYVLMPTARWPAHTITKSFTRSRATADAY
jgi:hypothetical protein